MFPEFKRFCRDHELHFTDNAVAVAFARIDNLSKSRDGFLCYPEVTHFSAQQVVSLQCMRSQFKQFYEDPDRNKYLALSGTSRHELESLREFFVCVTVAET